MSATGSIFLGLIGAGIGFALSFALHTYDTVIWAVAITMGACIIYTINERSKDLQKTLKDLAREKESKTE